MAQRPVVVDDAARQRRAAWLRAALDGLPALTGASPGAGSDWIALHARRVQALDRLLERLRAMPDRPVAEMTNGAGRVRMMGITAVSTMGVEGALCNWLARAEVAR